MNEAPTSADSVSTSSNGDEFRTQCSAMFLVSFLFLLASPPVGLPVVLSGGVVFADAWKAGIRKQPTGRGLSGISPFFWGIFVELLPIVALPLYWINRNRLSSRKGNDVLWMLTMIVGGAALLFFPFVAASFLVELGSLFGWGH